MKNISATLFGFRVPQKLLRFYEQLYILGARVDPRVAAVLPAHFTPETLEVFVSLCIHPFLDVREHGFYIIYLVYKKGAYALYAVRTCKNHLDYVAAVQYPPAAADAPPDISEQESCVTERQTVIGFMAEIEREEVFFFINIDIGLKKPIEKHETVYPGIVELFDKVEGV